MQIMLIKKVMEGVGLGPDGVWAGGLNSKAHRVQILMKNLRINGLYSLALLYIMKIRLFNIKNS